MTETTDVTETEVVPAKTVSDRLSEYWSDVKAHKLQYGATLLIGAVVMRAVDTRMVRSSLGDAAADRYLAALPLGTIPLING